MNLTTLELAALVIAVEMLALAWLVPFMLLRRARRRDDADRSDAAEMLAGAEAREPNRREALSTILSSVYHFEGEELDTKVNEFVEREQAFYQMMTRVYLERDTDGLKSIPEQLTAVISPWLRMTPRDNDSAARAEAAALRGELEATRTQMDSLMREYQAAFDKHGDDADTASVPDASNAPDDAATDMADDAVELAFDTEDAAAAAAAELPADATATPASEPRVIKLDSDDDADDANPDEANPDEANPDEEDALTQDELDALFSEEIEEVREA